MSSAQLSVLRTVALRSTYYAYIHEKRAKRVTVLHNPRVNPCCLEVEIYWMEDAFWKPAFTPWCPKKASMHITAYIPLDLTLFGVFTSEELESKNSVLLSKQLPALAFTIEGKRQAVSTSAGVKDDFPRTLAPKKFCNLSITASDVSEVFRRLGANPTKNGKTDGQRGRLIATRSSSSLISIYIHPHPMPEVKNKVCLIVHDGWGVATQPGLEGNAIEAGTTKNMDTIGKEHSYRTLAAHVTVFMGNSEVGHLNIGAGRIVWQDIVKIDVSIKKKEFHKNPVILESMKKAKEGNGRLHLLGLISDGEQGVPHTYVHFFGDGRDTAPRSFNIYYDQLLEFMKKEEYGELATVVGRYYAMDRDKRWERVKIAVDGLVGGEGEKLEAKTGVMDAIKSNYEKDVTDEFLKPIIVNGDEGRIKDNDTLFMFNYRSDRMREIVTVLGLPDKPMEVTVPKDLHHHHYVPVATYDKQPSMSVKEVAEKVASVVLDAKHEFIMCNFAPPDMVGHTGVFDAAVEAITHTDEAVGIVYEACEKAGYLLLITADHGNAEQMRNAETGAPHTAHTTNPVPFIMTGDPKKFKFAADLDDGEQEPGALCDVAPTVLDLLGLPQPKEMSGRSLLAKV
ncbi:hypothetical protein BT96DRAFT_936208 [Gymnopus androsaceus JB14]|uniref:phosphoglycerate mutase (2,3-diphosphoglycerate-independent) n=1 Tax=Gymnopus androsaceus JB14 TaxID=1447944 RepID=A0A6A4HWT4_9AGAR|nr:hypothetical protein BT96DRAFT_936208 [Gymnopus androsaceus JB14]